MPVAKPIPLEGLRVKRPKGSSSRPVKRPGETISEAFIERVCQRLAENKRVRRALPRWGRVHIDRQLPFLCVYRRPAKRRDPETEQLLTSEASYLLAMDNRETEDSLAHLVHKIVATLIPVFGSFLILEVWTTRSQARIPGEDEGDYTPYFRIVAPDTRELEVAVEVLHRRLKGVTLHESRAVVERSYSTRAWPPGRRALLSRSELKDLGAHLIGLEISPVYRNRETGQVYPLLLRAFERHLTRALKHAFFQFARSQTKQLPLHYQALGRRAMVKAVWEVDRRLANIENSFDFLLALTPTNAAKAWSRFKQSDFEREPEFTYRPIPIDPGLSKRALFNIPIEKIEDPLLAYLFREKQEELDRQITMLADRHRPQFYHGSLQVFGGVDNKILALAMKLLDQLPAKTTERSPRKRLNCQEIAERATAEIDFYRRVDAGLKAGVEVRSDVVGLMVSRGKLLIGKDVQVPASRVHALLQHEIGTHWVTYINGRAQPFRQLASGLAGYEELQEGLAVLAEFLVGGLSPARLRLLAARVVAVRRLTEGASFVDLFRELHDLHGFADRIAFTIAMRVFRGGGLTKDAVYLQGLVQVLEYLRNGGLLDPLFVGKMALDHVGLIEELQWRKVIATPKLRPRYLDEAIASEQLKRVRVGLSVTDLA